jgi:hypothetical protein
MCVTIQVATSSSFSDLHSLFILVYIPERSRICVNVVARCVDEDCLCGLGTNFSDSLSATRALWLAIDAYIPASGHTSAHMRTAKRLSLAVRPSPATRIITLAPSKRQRRRPKQLWRLVSRCSRSVREALMKRANTLTASRQCLNQTDRHLSHLQSA